MKRLLLTAAAVFGLAGTAHAGAADIMMGRMAIQLRQAGLDPESARWGAWAALHNPRSDCGIYANMIAGQADMPSGFDDSYHSTESNVMVIEREGLCTEEKVKRGIDEAIKAKEEQDRRDAKAIGIPEEWMKTGFTCGPNGCTQDKP